MSEALRLQIRQLMERERLRELREEIKARDEMTAKDIVSMEDVVRKVMRNFFGSVQCLDDFVPGGFPRARTIQRSSKDRLNWWLDHLYHSNGRKSGSSLFDEHSSRTTCRKGEFNSTEVVDLVVSGS